ncbi:MAG: amidohydrolase family protein, partial [Acidobacteria bacterium]|nr:amidohydrolase family protein [Acidobacteriota bacterium]
MNRFLTAILCVLFVAACSGEPVEKKSGEEVVELSFIFNGRIITGDGSEPIEEGTMIVDKGKIVAIGKKGEHQAPRGSNRVDAAGLTIMPLMVNLHGHPGLNNGASFSPDNYNRENVTNDLKRYLYYGVSAVLSAGGDAGDLAMQIRDELKQGKLTGAAFYTAGRGITARNGWPASLGDIPIQVSTEQQARIAVADNADKKVDFIKIWVDDNMGRVPKLTPLLYRAVIDEAHKRNLRVVAHVFYLADAKELVNAGVDGLIHSIRDREVDNALISAMKEKNVFLAPTLTAHEARFIYADSPRWLGEQTMREVYPASLSAYLGDPVTVSRFKRDADLQKYRDHYATALKNLTKMADGGVKIVLGTDSGAANTFPGYFEHRELELMAKSGMNPMDIIKSATANSAEAIGAKDLGTLAVDKNADFFVLTQNPLDDLANSKEIDKVWWRGHELDRLPLIQGIEVKAPRITAQDIEAERKAVAEAARKKAEDALEHYGPWPASSSNPRLRGLSIPTPLHSRFNVTPGPPDRITVSMSGGTAAQFSSFYQSALARYGWKAVGGCYERASPIPPGRVQQ